MTVDNQKGKDLELLNTWLYLHLTSRPEGGKVWDIVFISTALKEQVKPGSQVSVSPYSVLEKPGTRS